jgi:hypothetical protein
MDKDDREIDLPKFFFDNENLYTAVYKNRYKFDFDRLKELAKKLQANNYTYVYDDTADLATLQFIKYFVKHLIIPDGVTTISYGLFSGCKNLESITLGNRVTVIEGGVFSWCVKLRSIDLPESITDIYSNAFYKCESLSSVTLPKSLTYIASDLFAGCKNLVSVDIPNSVTTISIRAFSGCTSLEGVVIPDGNTVIDYEVFSGCTNLSSIVVPKSVTYVDMKAFSGCNNLDSIYYYGSEEDWNKITFEYANEDFINANRYYYSEKEPVGEGMFWRWVDGIPTLW